MLHQTFLFLGQLWQLFEVSQILEFLRYMSYKFYLYVYPITYHQINKDTKIKYIRVLNPLQYYK